VLGELVRQAERRAFIGISAQQTAIPARRRRAVGLVQESAVMVATVESSSAADRAGPKPGDIVLRLTVKSSPARTISSARSPARIGKSVALDALRGLSG
jgi:S1-C subfamily serine protease